MRRGDLYALLFGIGICLVLLAVAELAAPLFEEEGPPVAMTYEDEYWQMDTSGIAKPAPNGEYRSASRDTVSGKLIYDVVYRTDDFGRRRADVPGRERRDEFLLCFGCSFMYGEGLPEEETIPFLLASLSPGFMPYNYAFHGHGPSEMLAKMRSGTLRSEVPEEHGTLVYVFIDAHILRTIGSMRIATSWGKNRPYFRTAGDGAIVRQGTFTTGRPVVSRLYRLASKSRLLRALGVDLPIAIMERHVSFTAQIIAESRRAFSEQFPGERFLVVIYPGTRHGARLAELLRMEGVECLDCSGLFDRSDPATWLSPLDQHPNGRSNEILARRIAPVLRGSETDPDTARRS
ncbi:MAG: hypothetical protein EHM19_08345 [Candidatus Latescibacterota bacterium]|nr:MAG: hypothetical protein EHM19_08345 [Candidatus Latescibacterota bacterium]